MVKSVICFYFNLKIELFSFQYTPGNNKYCKHFTRDAINKLQKKEQKYRKLLPTKQ